ncbi:MAG: MotA/TolQ/ExbB proton channel family protein [Opitutales bacterium]|nr:MotA/TolQ/ExbB proton channel family protein [Opitutales bacterium]
MIQHYCAEYYEKLGPVGIPLAAALLLAVFLSVKIYLQLCLVDFQFRRFFKNVEDGNADLLFDESVLPNNPLVCVVRDIATKHRHHSDDLRAESAYLFHRYFYKTKRSFTTLRLITATAPLLGLLGTVLGIIQVFEVLGSGGNAATDSASLALGIGQALWTTVLGIVIAVPTLAVLFYLRNKLFGYMIVAVEFSYRAAAIAKNKKNDKE